MNRQKPQKTQERCRSVEKKRLELELAYCDATYDSEQALDICYNKAREASKTRENACMKS